jgi:hypothetical protein
MQWERCTTARTSSKGSGRSRLMEGLRTCHVFALSQAVVWLYALINPRMIKFNESP